MVPFSRSFSVLIFFTSFKHLVLSVISFAGLLFMLSLLVVFDEALLFSSSSLVQPLLEPVWIAFLLPVLCGLYLGFWI